MSHKFWTWSAFSAYLGIVLDCFPNNWLWTLTCVSSKVCLVKWFEVYTSACLKIRVSVLSDILIPSYLALSQLFIWSCLWNNPSSKNKLNCFAVYSPRIQVCWDMNLWGGVPVKLPIEQHCTSCYLNISGLLACLLLVGGKWRKTCLTNARNEMKSIYKGFQYF